ncbi:tripartite tricarboxylate transporter substrate binding protein [Cupriavidus basilensis]|uniref:tripartite tricarboxylate transporter substrate binding protein n=1 Tax=Cupriavidus basilensis TaxID=68895 RepID=UPI0020A6CAD0|nr:tripartite tricarboxylate transporter substrate binding protein [Cupriavidus basilensis]MCP3018770.1 tripartite tricarboxylate transporter substrate binding protein [Cupriavidus basilensis]
MRFLNTLRLGAPVILALLAVQPGGASAKEAWPAQAVRLVVPYAAGGPTDAFARVLAEQWGKQLGEPMIVENRTGAGTVVGTDYVAKAKPDGYVVLLTTVAHAVNESIVPRLPYRTTQDFAPVGLAAKAPLVLLVNRNFPARNLPEFLAYVKAHPGQVNYGSAGNGSAPHVATELLNLKAALKTTHIPYRGTGPAMTDLIGGQIGFMIDSAPTGLAQVRAGTVRLIATSMQSRLPQTPDTPAIAEAVPGYEAYTWNGAFVPAGTPAAVITTLNGALRRALADPGLKKRAFEMGLVLESDPTPQALAAHVGSEIAKWRTVAQAADIKEP